LFYLVEKLNCSRSL